MEGDDPLREVWLKGYSIAELWADHPPLPARRATSDIEAEHIPEPGILDLIEHQAHARMRWGEGAGAAYLREHLRSGEWIAIGYREPRKRRSRLVVLPKFEEASFGQSHSSVTGEGFRFVAVRVVHSKLLQAECAALSPRRAGRPPSAATIAAAYHRLETDGAINRDMRPIEIIRAVQALIAAERQHEKEPLKGFQEGAIRKALRPILEAVDASQIINSD
jgi:hypothetical protein